MSVSMSCGKPARLLCEHVLLGNHCIEDIGTYWRNLREQERGMPPGSQHPMTTQPALWPHTLPIC
eukprot:3130240-Prorocentrum_lima.AAC.1